MSENISTVELKEYSKLPPYFQYYEKMIDMSSGKENATEGYIKIIELTDTRTGIKAIRPEINSLVDFGSNNGWNAATYSRSFDGYEELMEKIAKQIKKDPKYAAKKTAKTFSDYGHNSVGDLNYLFMSLEGIPILNAFDIFAHQSTGAGQETSTRYFKIDESNLMPLKVYLSDIEDTHAVEQIQSDYTRLSDYLVDRYKEWFPIISDAHTEYIDSELSKLTEDESSQIDIEPKTIKARSLDIARRFLPIGTRTRMFNSMSARMWVDLVVQLKEKNDPESSMLAELLETMLNITKTEEGKDFKGDLDELTKHSEARNTVSNNKDDLERYITSHDKLQSLVQLNEKQREPSPHQTEVTIFTEINDAESLAVQYISMILPNVDEVMIAEVVKQLSDSELDDIVAIIINGHNRHNPMRSASDTRGGILINLKMAVADVRDFIRHRALGRFVKMLEHKDVLSTIKDGYNKNYQLQTNPQLKHFAEAWEDDFNLYYKQLEQFYFHCKSILGEDADLRFIYNLLPLNHQVTLNLSGPIGQLVYFLDQRIAPGGDISYRKATHMILEKLRETRGFGKLLNQLKNPDDEGIETWASRK